MKTIISIITIALLASCASWVNHHDSVTWPDGSTSEIRVSADGVVTAEKDGLKITADHRGRPSVVEQVLGVAASSVTNVVQVEKLE